MRLHRKATCAKLQLHQMLTVATGPLQMLLFRAYFDAHVQARFLFEQTQQRVAYAALRRALLATTGMPVRTALEAARHAMTLNDTRVEVAAWRSRVFELAATLNRTVGVAVLQSQTKDLNLGTFDTPLRSANSHNRNP